MKDPYTIINSLRQDLDRVVMMTVDDIQNAGLEIPESIRWRYGSDMITVRAGDLLDISKTVYVMTNANDVPESAWTYDPGSNNMVDVDLADLLEPEPEKSLPRPKKAAKKNAARKKGAKKKATKRKSATSNSSETGS